MFYRVSHGSTFHYTDPVSLSHHLLHLTPRVAANQTCRNSHILVDPAPAINNEDTDYFGNPINFLIIQQPHTTLNIKMVSEIEVRATTAPVSGKSEPWDQVRDRLKTDTAPESLDAYQYTYSSPFTTAGNPVQEYASASFPHGRPIIEGAKEFCERIFKDFIYDGSATDISTPVNDVLKNKRGVCQDFAHLQIAGMRQLGIPTRYVSGYIRTYPPEGQERLTGADASHAWLSVWCGKDGWIDFDPTNNMIPGEEHITVAWGRDYGDVSPINGVIVGSGSHEVDVAVDVQPLI